MVLKYTDVTSALYTSFQASTVSFSHSSSFILPASVALGSALVPGIPAEVTASWSRKSTC